MVDCMKYIRQLAVIMAVSFVGELLNRLLPLPVPGSVYGLVLMFLCLMSGVIKLRQVEDVGDFLVKIMPILFVGPCVSLMTVVGEIAYQIVPILIICIVSTVLVMAVTGWVAQAIMRKRGDREESHE